MSGRIEALLFGDFELRRAVTAWTCPNPTRCHSFLALALGTPPPSFLSPWMPPTAKVDGAPPVAQAELNGLLQADAANGRVPVHTFDPNSTPQEKAAAAGKGREQLKRAGAEEGAGETGTSCCECARRAGRALTRLLPVRSTCSGPRSITRRPDYHHLRCGRGCGAPRPLQAE